MLKWYFLLTHHATHNAEASDTAIVIPRFTLRSVRTEEPWNTEFKVCFSARKYTYRVPVVRSTNSVDISNVTSVFWFIPFPSTS